MIVLEVGSPGATFTVPLRVAPVQSIVFPLPGTQTNLYGSLGPAVSFAEMKVKPAGSVSVTLTLNAGSVPVLATSIWYVTGLEVATVWFNGSGSICFFVIVSSLNAFAPPT